MGPSFRGLRAASDRASTAARGASAKINTRCEIVLRRELWRRGLRYRLHCADLPGRPDIVFRQQRLAVFCDGDFWHGRELERRLAKLSRGHNSAYWVAKVQRNVERDRRQTQSLEQNGWVVLRLWESDILRQPCRVADQVVALLRKYAPPLRSSHDPASPGSSSPSPSGPLDE